MKIGIISDIHSNFEALTASWHELTRLSPDRIICLGDVIGYGADPNPCMAMLLAQSIAMVMGNHDYAMLYPEITHFFSWPAQQSYRYHRETLNPDYIPLIASWNITLEFPECCFAHACLSAPLSWTYLKHRMELEDEFRQLPPNHVLFIGHTHCPAVISRDPEGEIRIESPRSLILEKEHQYIINVGSIGQSRDGNPDSCFVIYDTEWRDLKFYRVAYPIREAAMKIYSQRLLPDSLGERLFHGI
ncbi:MAG: metallophosphoesterase [Candidatus Delongbacteria bacterium]|nr:metallophosphoesterase [Candidatus Delongbacteria bacterium]